MAADHGADLHHPPDPQHVPLRVAEVLDKISIDLRPIYTAPTATDVRLRYEEFAAKWGRAYPAIKTLWDNAWEELIPFLDYDVEIRKAIKTRGHFPDEQAATKLIWLAIQRAERKWRRAYNWTGALRGLKIHFGDRYPG